MSHDAGVGPERSLAVVETRRLGGQRVGGGYESAGGAEEEATGRKTIPLQHPGPQTPLRSLKPDMDQSDGTPPTVFRSPSKSTAATRLSRSSSETPRKWWQRL